MAVDCAQAHLTHAPGFVFGLLDDLCVRVAARWMEGIEIIDNEVGEVLVVAQVLRVDGVGAMAAHEGDAVAGEEPVTFVNDLEVQPSTRSYQSRDRCRSWTAST
ncbi:MAG: hypothetical protein R3B67_01635 [Phycisphaerales bacterium]